MMKHTKYFFSLTAFVGISLGQGATLMHHWTFDTDGSDSAGSSNATLESGTAITTLGGGQFGEALSVPATAAGAVVAPGGVVLPISDFTFSAWINQDVANTQGNGTIMGNQSGGAARGAWLRADTEGSDGDIFGRVNNAAGSLDEGGTITAGTWAHVAMTVSSTAGLTIYVDGAVVGSNSGGTSHLLVNTTSDTFDIGTRPGSGIQHFHGLIDDVAIFDGVLTPTEISNVISGGAQNFAIPEPSPTLFLGLAGLGLMRRRRSLK